MMLRPVPLLLRHVQAHRQMGKATRLHCVDDVPQLNCGVAGEVAPVLARREAGLLEAAAQRGDLHQAAGLALKDRHVLEYDNKHRCLLTNRRNQYLPTHASSKHEFAIKAFCEEKASIDM